MLGGTLVLAVVAGALDDEPAGALVLVAGVAFGCALGVIPDPKTWPVELEPGDAPRAEESGIWYCLATGLLGSTCTPPPGPFAAAAGTAMRNNVATARYAACKRSCGLMLGNFQAPARHEIRCLPRWLPACL